MLAVEQRQMYRTRAMWLAVVLAFITALTYLMMDLDLLAVGNLQPHERPSEIIYVAAGCYLIGGLLILLRCRWLWITGAGVNALVIFAFVQFYIERPAVLFSAGGVASKTAQLLLEMVLIYLILTYRRSVRRQPVTSQLEGQL